MLKRNFDHSQIDTIESYREEEPQAKRPNSASPKVNNYGFNSISQKENNISSTSPNNGQNSVKSNSAPDELQEQAPIDKTRFFDNVLNYFAPIDKNAGEDSGVTEKHDNGDIQPNERGLLAEDPKPIELRSEPSDAQPPQMLNPKATMKTNMREKPPDVALFTDQNLRCASGSQLYQGSKSVVPSSSATSSTIDNEIAKKEHDHSPPVTLSQMKQPECCIVENLIKRFNFVLSRVRPLSKKEIMINIREGRPAPAIPSLGVSKNLYNHHVWITGCPTKERLYCWLCLLFTNKITKYQNTVWLREGFRAMNMLGTSMTKHILSSAHKGAIEYKDQLVVRGLIPKLMPGGNLSRDYEDTISGERLPPVKTVSTATTSQSIEDEKYEDIVEITRNLKNLVPPLSPPLEPVIVPNHPNQGNTSNLGEADCRDSTVAFHQQNPQPEICDLTLSDDSEKSSVCKMELSKAKDSSKEHTVKYNSNYLRLIKELKSKEPAVEPPKETPTHQPQKPSSPSQASKTQTRLRIDLSTLQLKYFPNGAFTGSEMLREQIIAFGRPTPRMPGLVQYMDGVMVYFTKSYYKEFPWMCGSREMNRLYCWPCVVFNDRQHNNTWNTVGVSTLANLSAAAKVHSVNPSHLELAIRLKMYEGSIKNGAPTENNPSKLNEVVRQKRTLLKYLIDAVCFKKKLLNNVDICPKDFNDFLIMLSAHDVKLKEILDPKSENYLADFTPNVAANYSRETIEALTTILKRKIAAEVENSAYVSFILKTVKNNLVALIVRYTEYTGEVHERFHKFIEIGFGRQEALLKIILAEVGELKCSTKFVGISYDGGVLRPDQMESFNSSLRSKIMAAYFFHCREDNFKALLQQSLSQTPHCRSFFHLVTEFGKFLQENPRLARSMDRLDKEKVRTASRENKNDWDLKSGITITIRDHYLAIMSCLAQVVNGSLAPHAWSNHVVSQCKKFSMFLGLRETRLFLVLFSKVYIALHPTIEAFQGDFHAKYWKTAAGAAYSLIQDIRLRRLGEIYRVAEAMIGVGFDELPCSADDKTRLSTMFNDTLDWILAFMKYRSKYIDTWAYFDMSTKNIDSPVSKAKTNQTQFFMDLRECFPFFDTERLGPALIFAHKEERFLNKSAAEIIDLIVKWDLKSDLPELYSYLLLIQTVPLSSAHVSSPVSGRITAYIEGKTQLTSEDALLYLEKDLLASERNKENFYSDVINIVAKLKD